MDTREQALLGFDETIDSFCAWERGNYQDSKLYPNNHAGSCVNANHNILSIYGDRLPYNLCRNLEWQVAALPEHARCSLRVLTSRTCSWSRLHLWGLLRASISLQVSSSNAARLSSDPQRIMRTQVCAAQGLLPGQGTCDTICVRTFAPRSLRQQNALAVWRLAAG